MADFDLPHGQGSVWEPQRIFNWVVEIGDGAWAMDLIKLAVESVTIPQFGVQVIPIRYLNRDVKVAGGAMTQEMQITIRDFVDKDIFKVCNEWMKKVHDVNTGLTSHTATYKKDGSLMLLGPDGTPERKMTLKGTWPSTMSGGQLTYQNATEIVRIQMVLQVDKFIVA